MEDYHVIEQIGEGSFGKVFKGRRKFSGKVVALKFIVKHGKSDKDIKSLRQEIEILRTLRHENVIRMLDSFETKTDFVVVTEFAQGELFEILSDDVKLPEDVVQSIAKQLIRALHYLHSQRIIHRDMKPQNILIAAGGVIKLCDFGFARALSTQTMMMTSIKGTPLYMAPELVQEQPYTYAVDLWSVGVILFELYVGQPPFFTSNIYSLIRNIVRDPVKFPSSMSAKFKSLLQGLLTKDPRRRLGWPALLEHPFVKEEDTRLPLKHLQEQTGKLSLDGKRTEEAKSTPSVNLRRDSLRTEKAMEESPRLEKAGKPVGKRLLERIIPGSRDVTPSRQRKPTRPTSSTVASPRNAAPGRRRDSDTGSDSSSDTNRTPRDSRPKVLSRFADQRQGSRPSSDGASSAPKKDLLSEKLGLVRLAPSSDTIPAIRRPAQRTDPPAIRAANAKTGSGLSQKPGPQSFAPLSRPSSSSKVERLAIDRQKSENTKENTNCQKCEPPALEEDGPDGHEDRRASHSKASSREPSLGIPAKAQEGSILSRMLSGAETRASTQQGAEALLLDGKFTSLVLDVLKRPASGQIYTQWANGPDLLVAVRIGACVLRWTHKMKESRALLQSILSAAKACLAVQPKTTASIAEALSDAETDTARGDAEFVSFGETCALYADLVAQRGKHWEARIAGCQGLTGAFQRAQLALNNCSPTDGPRAAAARAVLDLGARGSPLVPKLCCCLENSFGSSDSSGNLNATKAVIDCLASLVHCPMSTASGLCTAQCAPLTALSSDDGDTAVENSSHSTLYQAVRMQVAEGLLGYRDLLQELKNTCLGNTDLQSPALLLILSSCYCSSAFCEAAAVAGLPEELIRIEVPSQRPLALLTFSVIAQGVAKLRSSSTAMQASLLGPEGPASYLARLLQESTDSLVVSASAAALAALQALRGKSATANGFAEVPRCMYQGPAVQALSRLLGSSQGDRLPAWHTLAGSLGKGGLLDGPLALSAVLIQQDVQSPAFQAAKAGGLTEGIFHILQSIAASDGRTGNIDEIHPQGLLSLLKVLQNFVAKSSGMALSVLLGPPTLPALAAILDQRHLRRLGAWAKAAGGGQLGVCTLVGAVTDLLLPPYCSSEINGALMVRLNKAVSTSGVVGSLVGSLKDLKGDWLAQPLTLISRLIAYDAHCFVPELQQAGGLSKTTIYRILSTDNSVEALQAGIFVVTLIARHGLKYYQPFAEIDICSQLKELLLHTDPGVRSRTLNLIGNLCKHASTFYEPLQRYGLVPIMVDKCQDDDRMTRKFACFAIGNAAFYDESLYDLLRPSCQSLVSLILHDEEEKTRANAAGAIGNLVRSSNTLCNSLISAGALQALLHLACSPLGAHGGATVSDEPMKVALYSLGNTCTHELCAQSLLKLGVMDKMRRLSTSSDPQIQKYCARIQTKLQVWMEGSACR